MRIFTREGRAISAAARWRKQYEPGKTTPDKEDIHKRLVALSHPTANVVDEIIGNLSWTRCKCDECGKSSNATVELGEEPDYDSHTVEICAECISKALALINATDAKTPIGQS